jgi:hypothetical protein
VESVSDCVGDAEVPLSVGHDAGWYQ